MQGTASNDKHIIVLQNIDKPKVSIERDTAARHHT